MGRIRLGIYLTSIAMLIGLFQNCSNNYKLTSDGSNSESNNLLSNPNPNTSPSPIPKNQIPTFSCQTVKVLPLTADLIVPARDSSGTCYAIQIFQAIQDGPSNLTTTTDPQVISRNHDISTTDSTITHHPYLMGQATINLTFEGARNIKLSGQADSTSPISVDNFVMVGFGAQSTAGLVPADYAAYGTSDSTVNNTNGVLLDNEGVALTPFASGGIATVEPLDISQSIAVHQSYTLDVRAEDCGGDRDLSDVYLLLQ